MANLRRVREKTTAILAFLISGLLGIFGKSPTSLAAEAKPQKPNEMENSQSALFENKVFQGGFKTAYDNSTQKEAPNPSSNTLYRGGYKAVYDNSTQKEAPNPNSNTLYRGGFKSTYDNSTQKEAPNPVGEQIYQGGFQNVFDNSNQKEAPSLNLNPTVENQILDSVSKDLTTRVQNGAPLNENEKAVLILIDNNRELQMENELLKLKLNKLENSK